MSVGHSLQQLSWPPIVLSCSSTVDMWQLLTYVTAFTSSLHSAQHQHSFFMQ